MIKYQIDSILTHVREWKFPDGTIGVDINVGGMGVVLSKVNVTVHCDFGVQQDERGNFFTINDQLVGLMMTMDALRGHYPLAQFMLIMPYFPGARQDRVFSSGEALGARIYANMINSLGFDVVAVVDPHSAVTEALLNNLQVVRQIDVFRNIYPSFREVYIVAPDQGALKKCEEFAKAVGAAGVIRCSKSRNMKDGAITHFEVLDPTPQNCHLLVLDDICDGGATFLQVAEALESDNPTIDRLDLAVTHGLFTKGPATLLQQYDTIFTTDSYIPKDNAGVTVIPV